MSEYLRNQYSLQESLLRNLGHKTQYEGLITLCKVYLQQNIGYKLAMHNSGSRKVVHGLLRQVSIN